MKAHWDTRYSEEGYAYGTAPNRWFEEQLHRLPIKGRILLAAEGEGRNAVFAASIGWEAVAFDPSSAGRHKAIQLADRTGVTIDYRVGTLDQMDFEEASFDALCLVYAHLPEGQREFHEELGRMVKPGGYVILEGFSKANLPYRERNPAIGGPPKLDMLFSLNQIRDDFNTFEPLILREEEVELSEGKYHRGRGMVIRLVGKKLSPW